jgi:hypothetical protein
MPRAGTAGGVSEWPMKRRTARERSLADEWPSRRPGPRWCVTDRDDAGRRSPYRCGRMDRTSGSAPSSRRRHCRRYRPWRSLARARNSRERRPRSHRPRCLVPSHRRPARASRAAIARSRSTVLQHSATTTTLRSAPRWRERQTPPRLWLRRQRRLLGKFMT